MGSWPWPWPRIGSYCMPSCITRRPLPTYQISLKSKKFLVDGRTYGRTDIWDPLMLLGRLGGVDLNIEWRDRTTMVCLQLKHKWRDRLTVVCRRLEQSTSSVLSLDVTCFTTTPSLFSMPPLTLYFTGVPITVIWRSAHTVWLYLFPVCANWAYLIFYVVNLGHIFVTPSNVICYNINKLTYLLTYLLRQQSCPCLQHIQRYKPRPKIHWSSHQLSTRSSNATKKFLTAVAHRLHNVLHVNLKYITTNRGKRISMKSRLAAGRFFMGQFNVTPTSVEQRSRLQQ